MPSDERGEKQAAAQQAVDILHEISTLLVRADCPPEMQGVAAHRPQNCHLDRRSLSICISMIENGINPEALAVRP